MGTTPAELTTITTVAHTHFGPRIWLPGRRFRSISATSPAAPAAAQRDARAGRSASPELGRVVHVQLGRLAAHRPVDDEAFNQAR
jgi:hypothetical protein